MNTEFLRFVGVGVVGFVVDGGGTWLLTRLGMPPIEARIAPLLTAIVVTWLLNRSVTFNVDKPKSRAELMRYATVALSSAFFRASTAALNKYPATAADTHHRIGLTAKSFARGTTLLIALKSRFRSAHGVAC